MHQELPAGISGRQTIALMSRRGNGWAWTWPVLVLWAISSMALYAETLSTIHRFVGPDGVNPIGSFVQATDGNLYSTASLGGAANAGTVLKINPAGKLTVIYSFCSQTNCADGADPEAGLTQGKDGNFYGTTFSGGTGAACIGGCGTVFKITAAGVLTTLHMFNGEDGANPYAGVVQASDGNLYGTTFAGGTSNLGTIFRITPGGALTTIHSFCALGPCNDGTYPYGALIQGTDGNLYGTTSTDGGPVNFGGTVFKVSTSGVFTTLASFCSYGSCPYGESPSAGVIQARDGSLYGTTFAGGAYGYGTVFQITPDGTLTALHNFCESDGCAEGSNPYGALIEATDGNFYGTTARSGVNGYGTVFQITTGGVLSTLYSFCAERFCSDGASPFTGLLQGTNGNLYGVTLNGGYRSLGTLFTLNMGLGAFVKTQPTSGKVGASVKVLGTNLSGTTAVTFNGTAASFKIASGSLIVATVPAGATTGTVQVVTPNGTLASNQAFTVAP